MRPARRATSMPAPRRNAIRTRPATTTVMADRSEARQAADVGDSGSGPSLGVFLGLVSASPAWTGGRAGERPATTARWTPQTHDPDLPERPPRAA